MLLKRKETHWLHIIYGALHIQTCDHHLCDQAKWVWSQSNSILIFLINCIHHLQNFLLQQIPLKLVNWFQRYGQLKGYKNKRKQKFDCFVWLYLRPHKKQSCFLFGGFSKFDEGGRYFFFFFFFFFFASERSRSTLLSCRCWLHIQLMSFMLHVIHTYVCFRAYICTNTCLNIFHV